MMVTRRYQLLGFHPDMAQRKSQKSGVSAREINTVMDTCHTQRIISLGSGILIEEFLKTDISKRSGSSAPIHAIIPHYPDHPFLEECILSMLNQSLSCEKISVVFDGAAVPAELKERFPSVSFVSTQSKEGPFLSVEGIIDQNDQEYIIRIDSDDVAHPNRNALLFDMITNKNLDLVGSNCVHFRNSTAHSLGVFPRNPSDTLRHVFGHVILYPAVLFRASFYKQIGGFNHFHQFGIDSEFVNRAAIRGRSMNCEHLLYLKRERDASLTLSSQTGFGSSIRESISGFTRRSYREELATLRARACTHRSTQETG